MERAVPYVWQRTTGTAQNRSPIPKLGAAAQPRCLFRSYPFDSACRGEFQHDGIWRNRGSLSKAAGDRASNFAQHGKFGAIGACLWSILPQLPGLKGFERRIAAGMGHIATQFADNPAALPGSVKKRGPANRPSGTCSHSRKKHEGSKLSVCGDGFRFFNRLHRGGYAAVAAGERQRNLRRVGGGKDRFQPARFLFHPSFLSSFRPWLQSDRGLGRRLGSETASCDYFRDGNDRLRPMPFPEQSPENP